MKSVSSFDFMDSTGMKSVDGSALVSMVGFKAHNIYKGSRSLRGMEFKELIAKVVGSEAYKGFKEAHADIFLAHVFIMDDGYQIGYYDKKTERITSFNLEKDKITAMPPSEVLKDPEHPISALELDKVAFSQEEALKIAEGCREMEYSKHPVMKKFFILQELKGKPMFNITFFTLDMNTVNVKVDAHSGKVVHHSLKALMDMQG